MRPATTCAHGRSLTAAASDHSASPDPARKIQAIGAGYRLSGAEATMTARGNRGESKAPPMRTRARLIWLLTGLAAGIAVLALMLWARQLFQIRTLPERIMEAVLLLVPPAQFEGAIERYGPAA